MPGKIISRQGIRSLSLLSFAVYFASYLTRINYGAIIAEIVQSEGILKSSASLVTTASFISYGAGQLVSGYIGDRVNPRWLIFGGLAATSVLNLFLPTAGTVEIMTAIWFLNGFAQAMIWPPLVKILSGYLYPDNFQKACVTVTIAGSVGTIFIYLVSPLCIVLSGWRLVFWVAGAAGLAASALWLWGIGRIDRYAHENAAVTGALPTNESGQAAPILNRSIKSLILPSGLLFIILGIILQGILRDGVTTWMPSYLNETFWMSSSVSILSTVILPVFSIFAIKFTSFVQRKFFTNELSCAALFFLIGSIASVALAAFYASGLVTSMILTAIITGCMHGVNFILICMVPGRFEQTGKVAFISGFLNFFTYLGSALSTYGIARFSENFGWRPTIMGWAGIALLGSLTCGFCISRWRSFCCGTTTRKIRSAAAEAFLSWVHRII